MHSSLRFGGKSQLIPCRALIVLACALANNPLHGQGTFDPVYTVNSAGSGGLVSTNTELDLTASVGDLLEFAFGFTTDETLTPGIFGDAFSISLESALGALAYYFVIDGSGPVVAPPTPGAILLDPASISLTPILFPASLPSMAYTSAYRVLAPIPTGFFNQHVTMNFDLFSNGDPLESLGWASAVAVVPEPEAGILLFLGLGIYAACRNWPAATARQRGESRA